MATEAIAGQNWLHILIEINLPRALPSISSLLPVTATGEEERSRKAQSDSQTRMSRFQSNCLSCIGWGWTDRRQLDALLGFASKC
jgi:hypothetical protein